MSKRLQVLFEEEELREIRKLAAQKHMTVAEWVRQTLRTARRGESVLPVEKKLRAVRAAARNSFPTANIDEMLTEIERGYGSSSE